MKVLVVGAGPSGLTAAIELARQGIETEVVERRTEASEMSRAVGIMPETIDKLRASGVADGIENEAMGLTKVKVHRGNKLLLDIDFERLPKQPVRHMWGLPQNRTEALMAEILDKFGVTVEYGCEVSAIETDDQRATVHFKSRPSKTYDWVIGADGRHSIVRQQLGIPYPGIDLVGDWSIADIDVEGYDPTLTSLWIQDEIDQKGAFYMILPIEHKRLRIVSSTPDVLATLPAPLDIRRVRRTGKFNISVRQAQTYQQGRVLLVGDSAHCHSPVGGRGMNLGIDDAVAAAKAIVTGTTAHYTEERHEQGAKVLKDSERARKMIMSPSKGSRLLTGMVMGLVQNSALMQLAVSRKLTSL